MTHTKNNQDGTQGRMRTLTRRQLVTRVLLLSSVPASASGVVGLCGLCAAADYNRPGHDSYSDRMLSCGESVADREGDG